MRAADLDFVFVALGGFLIVIVASMTPGVKEIVQAIVLVKIRAFDAMDASRIKSQLLSGAMGLGGITIEGDLENILPIGAIVQKVVATGLEQIGINGVPVVIFSGLYAGGAMVSPGARLHGVGSSNTDGRVSRAESGNRVVDIVLVANSVCIGGLDEQLGRKKKKKKKKRDERKENPPKEHCFRAY